ncbi:hypothetical protein ACRQ5Q_22565 [Bradyrhizobium sp. PMVTL-01]|uniref:hypothetical protein n=1 Tax=Bradyrhizobium sp. PMVTL-01 TaxID=3434999 RepID=UPI003F717906
MAEHASVRFGLIDEPPAVAIEGIVSKDVSLLHESDENFRSREADIQLALDVADAAREALLLAEVIVSAEELRMEDAEEAHAVPCGAGKRRESSASELGYSGSIGCEARMLTPSQPTRGSS